MKTQFQFIKNVIASNLSRLSFPYKLTFAVTYLCQSRCKLCSIWKKRPVNEITIEEIRRFFRRSNKFSWIDITGGEVFLRKDLVEIIKVILDNCKDLYMLHIPTNGLAPALIERKVHEILALNPKYFTITCSLDGPPKLNDALRGIPGDFDRAIETYRRLSQIKQKNFRVFIGFTLSHLNAGTFNMMYKEVKKRIPCILPKNFHMNIIHLSEHYYANNDLQINKKGFLKELEYFRKIRSQEFGPISYLETKYLELAKKYVKTGKTPITCQALAGSVFVDAFGDIYPCSIYGKRLVNIRDINYDIRKYWQHPKIINIRKEIISGKCPNCWTPCEAYQSILANLWKRKE